jgi:hypothetical protein
MRSEGGVKRERNREGRDKIKSTQDLKGRDRRCGDDKLI